MMKTIWTSLMLTVLVATLGAIGCSKKIEVDTVNLEYSFQTADEATQAKVTEAIEAIDKAEYSSAVEKLKTVAADPKLTAEQKTAINGVVQKIENP